MYSTVVFEIYPLKNGEIQVEIPLYKPHQGAEAILSITSSGSTSGSGSIHDNVVDYCNILLYRLAFEGRFLAVGFASGDIPKIPANLLLVKSASAVGLYWGSYSQQKPVDFVKSITATLRYFAEGKINPHICTTYPLDKVRIMLSNQLTKQSAFKPFKLSRMILS